MQTLISDTCYHIFNHANGFENVFRHEGNYNFFLEKYHKYIRPIAETYAYCLMPNHFHLVVRMRKREIIEGLIGKKSSNNFSKVLTSIENSSNPIGLNTNSIRGENFGKVSIPISDSEIEKFLSKQFANLFSSYTQSFNKVYHRMGSLFIKNFKREPIGDKDHFINTVAYTHRNPIHHGFCKHYDEWVFSSYNEIIQGNNNFVPVTSLLIMFGGLDAFQEMHSITLKNVTGSLNFEIP